MIIHQVKVYRQNKDDRMLFTIDSGWVYKGSLYYPVHLCLKFSATTFLKCHIPSSHTPCVRVCVCVCAHTWAHTRTLSHSVMSDSLLPHGLQPARLPCPWGFSRQEYCSGLPCPPPGDLANPGIKPRSPTLQVDSIPPGKLKTGVGSLSLLQGIFPIQEQNLDRCTAGGRFTS